MATATMPPRGRNQNQPPAAPAPAPAPAPAAPPAPRPVTPATAVSAAAIRLVGRGAEMIEEAEARDNVRRQELEATEHRRRQSFSRAVRWIVGIVILLGVAALATWAILTVFATDDSSSAAVQPSSSVADSSSPPAVTAPHAPTTPPAPPATDAMSASASAQVNIVNYCGEKGCMTFEVLHPSPTVKAHCLDNHPNKLRAQFEECCGRIPNPTERSTCLAGIGQIPSK